MKIRLGLFLMGVLTLLLLVIIGSSFEFLNMASNLAVFFGYCIIGSLVIFSPWLYHWIWVKFIASNQSISSKEEK